MNTSKKLTKNHSKIRLRSSTERIRVLVKKSLKYDYLQAINDNIHKIIFSLSTKNLKGKNRKEKAQILGCEFAKILKGKKQDKIVFDRLGYKYHGRIMLIAQTLRKNGIKF